MKRLIFAVLAASALAVSAVAQTSYTAKDGSTPQQVLSFCAYDASGVKHPCHVLEGISGGVPRPWAVDSTGAGSVNVLNTPTVNIGSVGGGATASGQGQMLTALGTLVTNTTGVATAAGVAQDVANNAPFGGEVAMVVGTPQTPQRSLKAICTAAGNIAVTYADASTGTWAAVVGVQTFPIAISAVNSSGTTATCGYTNLK